MEGNGFKPEDTSVSTHIVESCVGSNVGTLMFNRMVEQCYADLNERARKEKSIIVNVTQSVTSHTDSGFIYVNVIITAQRISLADLERQQRAAQLRQGIR